MPKTMRAVAKDKAGTCGAVEVAVPQPKPGEVLIRVRAISVNHGDWASGKPLRVGSPGKRSSVMCSDAAGVVMACGQGVSGFEPGDEVCAATVGLKGAFAEYAVAKQSWCAHKPQTMSWELAAAVPSVGVTALAAVEKGGVGKTLVVGASGGVGQFALALAVQGGGEADAVCSGRNAGNALRLGAGRAYDYARGLGAIEGSYDTVLAVNGSYPASEYLRFLPRGGSLVLVGFDSLKPSMLAVPMKGRKLRAALFFARVGTGGLQKACDLLASCGDLPDLELVHGFAAGVERLAALADDHPHGKLVISVD